MADSFMSRCGTDCQACDWRAKKGCPGCVGTAGQPFWGECDVAKCCIEKGHDHCGKCAEFPCETLNGYAYDPGEGDNGKRIENLRAWNAEGYDAWRNRVTQ